MKEYSRGSLASHTFTYIAFITFNYEVVGFHDMASYRTWQKEEKNEGWTIIYMEYKILRAGFRHFLRWVSFLSVRIFGVSWFLLNNYLLYFKYKPLSVGVPEAYLQLPFHLKSYITWFGAPYVLQTWSLFLKSNTWNYTFVGGLKRCMFESLNCWRLINYRGVIMQPLQLFSLSGQSCSLFLLVVLVVTPLD